MRKPSQASPGKRRTRLSPAERAAAAEEKLNRHWRAVFIRALAETSNVAAAAKAAGVASGRPYKVRRMDPEFARQWQDALCEGYDNLELELLHRLRFGEPKGEAGEPATARRFDNGAALRQLAFHRETVSRLRAIRDHEDADAVRASIDARLASLRTQIAARGALAEDGDDAHGAG